MGLLEGKRACLVTNSILNLYHVPGCTNPHMGQQWKWVLVENKTFETKKKHEFVIQNHCNS